MTGLPIVMGDDRAPHEIVIQVAGEGLRMETGDLQTLLAERPGIRSLALAYVHAFHIQVAGTALANGRQKLEHRLARWILMSLDRLEGNEVPLTHEFVAVMLGVRRPGVTLAMHMLEDKGLVRSTRSRILVMDRDGLEALANGFYGVPEREYRRLIGEPSPPG